MQMIILLNRIIKTQTYNQNTYYNYNKKLVFQHFYILSL